MRLTIKPAFPKYFVVSSERRIENCQRSSLPADTNCDLTGGRFYLAVPPPWQDYVRSSRLLVIVLLAAMTLDETHASLRLSSNPKKLIAILEQRWVELGIRCVFFAKPENSSGLNLERLSFWEFAFSHGYILSRISCLSLFQYDFQRVDTRLPPLLATFL